MKHILLLFVAIVTLTGFVNENAFDQTEVAFRVQISYIGLPSPLTTIYDIDQNKIKVYKTIYSSGKDTIKTLDERTFRNYDNTKLTKFLSETNWDTIPNELITPTIDGYQYMVDINIEEHNYHFYIDNTYNKTLDSLMILCNESIPKKRFRNKFYLPYSEWKE